MAQDTDTHKKKPVTVRLSQQALKHLDALGPKHGGKTAAIEAALAYAAGANAGDREQKAEQLLARMRAAMDKAGF